MIPLSMVSTLEYAHEVYKVHTEKCLHMSLVGRVKKYVEHAMESLGLDIDEVTTMSIQELDALLEQKEQQLRMANADIRKQIDEQGWDVDVDEDGPFICIASQE